MNLDVLLLICRFFPIFVCFIYFHFVKLLYFKFNLSRYLTWYDKEEIFRMILAIHPIESKKANMFVKYYCTELKKMNRFIKICLRG